MNKIRKLIAYLRYREAVKQADKAHQETGERYYVPYGDGKLIIVDRKNFRSLKNKHYIDHKVKVRDLLAECFYFTPYRNGNGYIDDVARKVKLESYYSYIDAVRKTKKKR
jgi:hypothetical protein